jgi:diaminohydroxyphosphoribosylaminopyrimidine deaminase/5-amino-6-(5-phosphoribosylamino)uracil reductase
MISTDKFFMKRALDLAAKGAGLVSPNPMVGALLVHDGEIIGEGYHEQFGQSHAEINCLDAVQDQLRHLIPASTMYVTLEPCAHHGKTPPCADRLVREGLKTVMIATSDPNPLVNGKGIAILKKAGIEVRVGILEEAVQFQNRRFFTSCQKGRPYILLKWAQTGDGFISSGTAERLKITSHKTDMLVHQWRAEGPSPLRIVLDSNNSLPRTLSMFNDGNPVVIINRHKDLQDGNLRYKKIEKDMNYWKHLFIFLHELNIQGLMVEGGAQLISSMIEAGYWDEIRVLTNPIKNIISGIPAPTLPTNIGKTDHQQIGDELLHIYYNSNQ